MKSRWLAAVLGAVTIDVVVRSSSAARTVAARRPGRPQILRGELAPQFDAAPLGFRRAGR